MKIEKSTIVRTIAVLIVIINIILEKFGIDVIDVDEVTILAIVEVLIEIAVIIVVLTVYVKESCSFNCATFNKLFASVVDVGIFLFFASLVEHNSASCFHRVYGEEDLKGILCEVPSHS